MADKRLLAIVPARGGSKRLPRKNVLSLGGKPLIGWTIDAALDSHCFVDVLVSTDDEEIAAVAGNHGALVPWLRPVELATDTARSIDVVLHALDWYEEKKGPVDGVMLLQPTSPFRTTATIRRAIELFCKHPHRSVVSFSEAESHPMWCYSIMGNSIEPFLSNEVRPSRSQDLPPAYVVNGAIYIASSAYLRANGSFLEKDTIPLVMNASREIIDIDTDWDWVMAENLLKVIS